MHEQLTERQLRANVIIQDLMDAKAKQHQATLLLCDIEPSSGGFNSLLAEATALAVTVDELERAAIALAAIEPQHPVEIPSDTADEDRPLSSSDLLALLAALLVCFTPWVYVGVVLVRKHWRI